MEALLLPSFASTILALENRFSRCSNFIEDLFPAPFKIESLEMCKNVCSFDAHASCVFMDFFSVRQSQSHFLEAQHIREICCKYFRPHHFVVQVRWKGIKDSKQRSALICARDSSLFTSYFRTVEIYFMEFFLCDAEI